MSPEIFLTGPRVTIRSYTREDLERQQTWPLFDDPLLESYMPRHEPGELSAAWLRLIRRVEYMRYAIDDVFGDLVGTVSLRDLVEGIPAARLGIVLRSDRCGAGLGTEALRLFVTRCLEGDALQRIDLDVAAYNTRAIGCYRKLGFRTLGERWQAVNIDPDQVPTDALRAPYWRVNGDDVDVLHLDMAITR